MAENIGRLNTEPGIPHRIWFAEFWTEQSRLCLDISFDGSETYFYFLIFLKYSLLLCGSSVEPRWIQVCTTKSVCNDREGETNQYPQHINNLAWFGKQITIPKQVDWKLQVGKRPALAQGETIAVVGTTFRPSAL